jgi:hypothetical protein
MNPEVVKIPCSAEMIDALDQVVELAEEEDNGLFEAPVRAFWDVFFAECDEIGLCHRFPPSLVLGWLEAALIADESVPVELRIARGAAVATITQILFPEQHEQREQATWN